MSLRDDAGVKPRIVLLAAAALLMTACAPRSSTTTVPSTTTVESTAVVVKTGGTTLNRELVTSDRRTRSYHLFVPAALPTGPVPLLVALHGGTGSGTQFQRQSGFDDLAEAGGFLVVFPDGVGRGRESDRLRTWNGGYCCGTAATQNVDDVGFIDQLIDAIAAEYPVDPTRVFAAGHSNGGIMAYRLACELSDRIVAIGLQAGSLGVDECDPSQPVSILHLHGTADENHPIEGGEGPKSIADVSFNSAAYSVETTAAAMGCEPEPTDSSWTQCDGGVEIRLVAVAGAPHSWMADESVVILEFLLNHPRV